MPPSLFYQAAYWVTSRSRNQFPQVRVDEIALAIDALHGYARTCRTAILLPDLFPGISLETLIVPKSNTPARKETAEAPPTRSAGITAASLMAIGTAIRIELEQGGHDMLHCDYDYDARVFAYLPEVRETVLMATGVVLAAE